MNLDTRIRITTIVDHKSFYGFSAKETPAELIKDIPSVSLLNYISFLNAQLYLNDDPEEYSVQKRLMLTVTTQAGANSYEKLQQVFERYRALNQLPIIFWNYSNLLFYDLIFSNFNDLAARDLEASEVKSMLDAYLIINSITDERYNISEEQLNEYADPRTIALFTVAKFMYQRDYFSTKEMQNQLVRGCCLFDFMEYHPFYGKFMPKYYQNHGVSGYGEIFRNLLIVFTEAFSPNEQGIRKNIINLEDFSSLVNFTFLDNISINENIPGYKKDINFSTLRNKMFYKVSAYKYVGLNMNFVINYFYKAQIFSLNRFLSEEKIASDFLSVKAKGFMEDIYFKKIMKRCFVSAILHFGDTAILSNNNELCDGYLRQKNRIALIELKDVMLNAVIKHDADVMEVLGAIKKKFLVNEKDKAKGIGQLLNAITSIISKIVPFDPGYNTEGSPDIFPIIMYTDDAFSCDGLNKILNEMFQEELSKLGPQQVKVRPLTIINLNFLEAFENRFSSGEIDLFSLIEEFHKHVQNPDYHLTPFEVFSKFYLRDNPSMQSDIPQLYMECSRRILSGFLPPF